MAEPHSIIGGTSLKGKHKIFNDFFERNFSADKQLGTTKRIEFIDLAKGICILLVVYYHSNMSDYLNIPILGSLRMPLYFLLSGLFFKDYGSIPNLLEKKLNKLIVPWAFFSLIALPLVFINFHTITFQDLIAPIANPKGGYNGPIWFLLSLFWVNIIFGIITLIFHRILSQSILVISLCSLGLFIAYHRLQLPLFMTQALIAMPFFFAGYAMKKTELLLYNPRYDRYLLFISIIALTICILIFETIGSPHLDFLYLDMSGNALLIYIFSTIVVVSVLLIYKSIKWLPVISYMGRFSVIILGLHWLFIKAYSLGYSYLISPDLNMPFRFVIVVLACWVSIPVVLYFVPGMVAQKDIIRFPKNTKK